MTLVYRGVWQDDREHLTDVAFGQLASWLATMGVTERVPDEGHLTERCPTGQVEIVSRRAISGEIGAVQVEVAEDRDRTGLPRTTRLTVIEAPDGNWVWVDVERAIDGRAPRVAPAAPRIAGQLIDAGRDARVDHVRLSTRAASTIHAKGIAGLIRHPDRTLPLVVFSEDPAVGFTPTQRRADRTAARLAGAAQVIVLPRHEVDAFCDLVGTDGLDVRAGDARVFLPNAGPDGLRPDRHRLLTLDQMGSDPARAAALAATLLAGIITARPAPASYERVRRELRLGRERTDAELLALAEAEIARLSHERDDLTRAVSRLEDELFDTQSDLEEAVVAENRAQNHLHALHLAISAPHATGTGRREGSSSSFDEDATARELTAEPTTMSEALALARERLGHLALPVGIERDLDDLDSTTSARAWAISTWIGLRALDRYAAADFPGDFWLWCRDSGHEWAWPANPKKLALHESETVQSNERLAKQRVFPVDPLVDPRGRTTMWAHLKIAEGGGPLAPRVYFHDDTRGTTGKVHVGFIGPHHHVENTKTN